MRLTHTLCALLGAALTYGCADSATNSTTRQTTPLVSTTSGDLTLQFYAHDGQNLNGLGLGSDGKVTVGTAKLAPLADLEGTDQTKFESGDLAGATMRFAPLTQKDGQLVGLELVPESIIPDFTSTKDAVTIQIDCFLMPKPPEGFGVDWKGFGALAAGTAVTVVVGTKEGDRKAQGKVDGAQILLDTSLDLNDATGLRVVINDDLTGV